jgi:hypothetical protein
LTGERQVSLRNTRSHAHFAVGRHFLWRAWSYGPPANVLTLRPHRVILTLCELVTSFLAARCRSPGIKLRRVSMSKRNVESSRRTLFHVFRAMALLTTCGVVYLVFCLAQSEFTYVLIPLVVAGAVALQILWIDIAAEWFARARTLNETRPRSLREKLWREFGLRTGRRVWSDPMGQRSGEGIFKAWRAREGAIRHQVVIIIVLVLSLFGLIGLMLLIGHFI